MKWLQKPAPQRRSHVLFLVIGLLVLITTIFYACTSRNELRDSFWGSSWRGAVYHDDSHGHLPASKHHTSTLHPIDELMQEADDKFSVMLEKETFGVKAAAAAYRKARGRHPPPRFDQWVQWCEERGIMMIEEFYDQLAADLEPFWGVEPAVLRRMSSFWRNVVSIRNGTLKLDRTDHIGAAYWMHAYARSIERHLPLKDLPDVDLMFNVEDTPRVYPPFSVMQAARGKAEADKRARSTSQLARVGDFAPLTSKPIPWKEQDRSGNPPFLWENYTVGFEGVPIWELGRPCCAPGTPGAEASSDPSFGTPAYPWFDNASTAKHMYKGFVRDFAGSKSSCENPRLRQITGMWVAGSMHSSERDDQSQSSILHDLVPVISGSKMAGINGDILCPPAMQLEDAPEQETYAFAKDAMQDWNQKEPVAYWLGSAIGGDFNDTNWTRWSRHRFMALTNATLVGRHMKYRESGESLPEHVPGGEGNLPHNFPLPGDGYALASLGARDGIAATVDWIANMTLTGFSTFFCVFFSPHCAQVEDAGYSLRAKQPQDNNWRYKFLPDIDGSTYSGRFRSFLYSNSLPIKATMFDEWHDPRYIPWRHFVPMDNTFVDFYAIMEYFAGYQPSPGSGGKAVPAHDREAQRIAHQGAQWARRASKPLDQEAYFYRMILELARLADDRRLDMGWTEDLARAAAAVEGEAAP